MKIELNCKDGCPEVVIIRQEEGIGSVYRFDDEFKKWFYIRGWCCPYIPICVDKKDDVEFSVNKNS